MKKHSKLGKRVLSVLMSIAVMISVIVPALTVFDFTAAAADGKLTVNSDGSFRVLQVPDIQTKSPLPEDTVTMIETAIAKYNPNLIVMTGDNVVGCVNDQEFRNTADEIVSLFKDESGNTIPFAVTFGNHDYEGNNVSDATGWTTTYGSHTIKRMYEYFKSLGAIDFDDPNIADVGTGYIDVYDQAGSKVVRRIIIINSATYDDNGGYGKAGYNQTNGSGTYTDEPCYNSIVSNVNSWTGDSSITCLAFQHIPLREFYTSGILQQDANGITCTTVASDSGISGAYSANESNEMFQGYYWETCSCSYSDTSALYNSLAKNNVLGIFYGHDHGNTLMGKGTVNGKTLVQGYGGGLNTEWNGKGYCALRYMTITSSGTLDTNYWTDDPTDSSFINKDEYETFGRKFASTATSFISDLTADGASDKFSNVKTAIENAGYTVLEKTTTNEDADLNKGCGSKSKYIAIGYKTSANIDDAITDVKILQEAWNSPESTIEIKGITYQLAANYDLNQDASNTKFLYLYYTKDKSAGAPITNLGIAFNRYCDASFTTPFQVVRDTGTSSSSYGRSNQTAMDLNLSNTFGTVGTATYMLTHAANATDVTREYLALCEAMRTYGSVTDSVLYTAASWSDYSTARNLVYNYIKYFNEGAAAPAAVSSDNLKNAVTGLKTKYAALVKEQSTSNDQAIATSSASGGVKLAFPETIYLKVSSGKATQAQYYLNNKIENGNLVADGTTSSTGKFEVQVSSDNVKQIKIQPFRVESITESNGKITGADYYDPNYNIFYMKSNITTGNNVTWYSGDNYLIYGVNAAPLNNKVSGEIVEGWCHLFGGYNGSKSDDYGLNAGETALIEWRVDVDKQVNLAGDLKTVTQTYYAYTTVYAPMNHSIGAITSATDYATHGFFGGSTRQGDISFSNWISGVQGLSTTQVAFGANAYTGNSKNVGESGKGYYLYDPITNLSSVKYKGIENFCQNDTKLSLSEFMKIDSNNAYVNAKMVKHMEDGGKKDRTSFVSAVRSSTGMLSIDTSRFTNLNQIPNFYVGVDMIGSAYHDSMFTETSNHLYGFYNVSDATNATSPSYGNIDMGNTLKEITNTDWIFYLKYHDSNVITAPQNTVLGNGGSIGGSNDLFKYGDDQNAGIRMYNQASYSWDKNTSWNHNFYSAIQVRNDDSYSSATCIVKLGAVTKETMRKDIGTYTNAGLQEKWDKSSGQSDFTTFKYALMKAYRDLGNPTSLTTDYSALTTAYNSCKATQLGEGKVVAVDRSLIRQINSTTGDSNTWTTTTDITSSAGVATSAEVKIENWFINQSTGIDGYKLIGNSPKTALADTVTSNTAADLDLKTSDKYTYEYTVSSLDYLTVYYYYNLPDYTLTIDLDGGTGISYTSVIGTPGSTLTLPTVLRSGYTFAGWTLSGAGSPTSGNQNMTYTFGKGNATLTANWVANPQNLIIDSNGGRYTGNLLYTSVNTSLSGGSTSSIAWNIKANSDSFNVSGSFAAGESERTVKIPMWCYLKYNQTYRITFTSTTPYSELYLFKDGKLTVRNAFTVTSSTAQQDGLYVYTADFTVGVTGNNDCTWVGNQDTTGSYQIRLDQNSSAGGDYTVSGLRIEELTESTGSDVYIIQTTDSTRYVPTPKRDGYKFTGWTITPTDNSSHITGSTFTYGWSDTTLVANWQETTVSYDVNHDSDVTHDSIGVNLYAPPFKTQTVNGITYSYDPETDVITLNGTASQNAHFEITPFIPEADSTYSISIEKVGGTATRSGSACIVLEAKTAGGGICRLGSGTDAKLGNFYVNEFNSGVSASWSFTSEQANSGNYKTLGLWTWVNTGASITFNDYKIKVKVEKSNSPTEFSPNTHYVLDSGAGLFPEVSRTDFTLLGWSEDSDATVPSYTVGQANTANFKYANTKLYAVWLETATSDERVGTVEVAKGITVTNLDSDTPSVIYETDKKKYEYIADETYKKLCEAYETALAAFTNKATKNLTTAQALYDARKALDADEYQSGSYVYNAPVVYYTDKFEINYSGVDSSKIKIPAGTHSVKDMNLNWYSTATLDETETAYDDAMAAKDQETVNSNVVKMASNLVFETETVKTSNPVLKIYDTETGAVNYVHNNKGSYTYYCYTNNPSPKLRITVEDTAGSGRILYPTKATENDITVNKDDSANLAKTENLYSLTNVKRTDSVDNGYSKYLNSAAKLGTTYGENYYNQKQEITLTPEFSGTDGSISYTMTATDDAYTPNAISSASLSGLQTQEKSATDKKITIYISYHKTTSEAGKSNSFCATGAQVDLDKHLNQYHLFRSSGGAMNWELPKTGDKDYTVNDGTYGQTDRGSFTFTYELGATDIGSGKINTTDVNEIVKLFKTEANYNAAKSMTFVGAKYWVKEANGTYTEHEGSGLGYQVWGNNWSYNYYPKTGAYTYVHLVDRWGNVFDKVFCVGPQDYKEIQSQSNGNGYTLLEDGGSGIDTLSLNAAGYELLTDENSTLEDGVYKTTGNTVRIKTGEANKSYTLTMKDKATNSSTATLVSDENGIITLSIEDTAYTSGVYTFMLDQTEINLYDGVDTGKYIKEVYSDEAEEGETARLTVIATGEVSKVRTTDTEGNTITNNVYTQREDGTREFVFERTLAAGTYSYRIEAKSGKVWYDEGKTGVLTFTEKVLASGVIKAAEYDAATGVCKVTVEGRAGKVQIVSADGSTRTYTRYHKSVTSITSYDASGAAVSDTSRELDTEVWTLNVRLTGTDYTAVGKFEAGWNRANSATKKLVINK